MKNKSTRILLWHWGRRGAGPKLTLDLMNGMIEAGGFIPHYSVSKDAHIYNMFPADSVTHMDVHTLGSKTKTILSFMALPWRAFCLYRFLKKNHIDVICNPMWDIWQPFLSWIPRIAGVKQVLYVHDGEPHLGESCAKLIFWLIWKDVKRADLVVFHSEYVKNLVCRKLRLNPKYTLVSPLGPSLFGEFPPHPHTKPSKKPLLLCFGRIYQYKGVDIALDAMPILRKTYKNARLRIYGGGDVAPYLKRISKQPCDTLESGFIPEKRMRQLLLESDIIVVPYREASQSAIITTAQTMGIPVVCTPVGGLPEQVKDGVTGIIASSTTPQDLSNAISRLLCDRKLYARCACEAQQMILNNNSWKQAAKRLNTALNICRPTKSCLTEQKTLFKEKPCRSQ